MLKKEVFLMPWESKTVEKQRKEFIQKAIQKETSLSALCREYGLPKAILCDNGNPWGSVGKGYTAFDVWMMQMDVLPIHGRILHPQTQGKDERFHRTLKEDVLKRTFLRDLEHAQEEFDKFRYCYNYERPHESLGLDVPAKHYKASKRLYNFTTPSDLLRRFLMHRPL